MRRPAAVEDLDDVFVADARQGPRLLEELVDGGRARVLRREHLDDHLTLGGEVLGIVQRAPAQPVEPAHDAVAVEEDLTEKGISAAAAMAV